MSDPSIQRGPSKEVPCIGYDATTKHAYVPLEAVSVQQDVATGQWYGVLNVNATVSPAANQRVNAQSGDFVDGALATLGAKADTAITDSTTTNTTHSFIKGLVKIFNDIWDNTNHWLQVKVMNGNANGQATKVNSSPVVLASDQEQPVNRGTPTGSVVSVGTGSTAVVTPGANAKLLILINDSPSAMYLNISGGAATLNAGIRLNANGGSILFDRYVPSAAITAISSVASSNLLVEVG